MNILIIDAGTTSIRGLVFDTAGYVKNITRIPTPLTYHGTHIEQSPALLEQCLIKICTQAAQSDRIDAIAVTAYRSAPALFDSSGTPLCSFIMWQDTRNAEICRRLKAREATVLRKCGSDINTVFTASKLTWLKENVPDLYAQAYKAMIVPDYLIHLMTDVFQTDYTYGSRTLLMDLNSCRWDPELCALFSISPEKLCPLIPPGSIAGSITRSFSQRTGLASGIPVITAGGDQQCSALGSGVLDAHTLLINMGTGGFLLSVTNTPVLNRPHMICNAFAVPGQYMAEANVLCQASALNWLIAQFYPELKHTRSAYDAINKAAETVPPGSNSLFCLPHFQGCGSRSWNPEAAAAFIGLTLNHTRADMTRALYEGLAAEIVKSIPVLPKECRSPRKIYLSGGLSKSSVLDQILCDMLGCPVDVYQNPEATAIGAFVSAAVTLGQFTYHKDALYSVRKHDRLRHYRPDSKNHRFYQTYLTRSETLYQALNI